MYGEGIFIGYRHYDRTHIPPLFPFGHGLCYTQFEYGRPSVTPKILRECGSLEVIVAVTNIGDREGMETVQFYVRRCDEKGRNKNKVVRPEKELVSFEKVELEPDETKHIRVILDKYAVGYWDVGENRWVAEQGKWEVLVAASAGDVRYVLPFLRFV